MTLAAFAFLATTLIQTKPPTVWVVDYVKVAPNMRAAFDDYRRSAWLPARKQAVKEHLIISFQVLEAPADAKLDYDLLLMTEYPTKDSIAATEPRWVEILRPLTPKLPTGLKSSDLRQIVRSVVSTTVDKG